MSAPNFSAAGFGGNAVDVAEKNLRICCTANNNWTSLRPKNDAPWSTRLALSHRSGTSKQCSRIRMALVDETITRRAKDALNSSEILAFDLVQGALGTSMASLIHMQKILSNRMQHFSSIEEAIEWIIKGGTLRNLESACVSIPTTLKYDESRNCSSYRAQLEETEQYWRGWYEGLSEKFLSSPVPKLLLLAGTDRLDRTLTIGQMQGKFQMVVVRHSGHAIQEDSPDEFSLLILNFIGHNRIRPRGVEVGIVFCPP